METVELKVKAIEREVKNGKEKGKKFMTYRVKNVVSGFYEELRFNQIVTNQPKKEGMYLVACDRKDVNRIGTDFRDYPLTWVKGIQEIKEYAPEVQEDNKEDLPF